MIKDPNEWINPSQWERGRKFLKALVDFSDEEEEPIYHEPEKKEYSDPLDELPMLQEIDEGDYSERTEELPEKWREKFFNRTEMWNDKEHVEEILDNVHFADGKSFVCGDTSVRFTEFLFHGIEYSKTGWVVGMVVEKKGEKFLYSSDLQGPTVEDNAQWIINEDPDFLILDGPATYLLDRSITST